MHAYYFIIVYMIGRMQYHCYKNMFASFSDWWIGIVIL